MQNHDTRLMPHNLEAERAILGNILVNPPALFDAQSVTAAKDWYLDAHRTIYSAMCEMQAAGEPIDLLSVKNRIQRDGKLEAVGGAAYLVSLTDGVPRATNVKHYAGIVRDCAELRHLIQLGNNLMERAYSGEEQAGTILGDLRNELLRMNQPWTGSRFVRISDYLTEAYDEIDAIGRHKLSVSGIDTGFRTLNRLTQGFHAGELIIVAGRPGDGKTSFAQNVANHVSVRLKKRVGIFSLEMSGKELAKRSIYAESPLDSHDIPAGKVDWTRVSKICGELGGADLHIYAASKLDISQLHAAASSLALERKLDLLIVDYLQLMDGGGRRNDTREREIANISRGLKQIAGELQVPVIALSQLNRLIEKEKRPPRLSDLRESGSLEQDADMVLFLWRPNASDPNDNSAQLRIGKNRHGPAADTYIDLIFEKQYCRFLDGYDR